MTTQPTLLVDDLTFPEGPRWREDELWFSEFTSGTVRSVALDRTVRLRAKLDDSPSGLGFLPSGQPLVVSMREKLLVRLEDDSTAPHADLRELPGDFLNDMLVDPDGRAYVGCRSQALRPARIPLSSESARDAVAIVEPDGGARVGAADMISPNGTVLTRDGAAVIVAETYAQRLLVFERSSSGALGKRSVFAELPGRYPDGICLDDAGGVWVGSPYTHEFVRVCEGGAITDRIPMIGGVACALGGPDGRTLFLLGVAPAALPGIEGVGAAPAGPDAMRSGRIATVRTERPAGGWM